MRTPLATTSGDALRRSQPTRAELLEDLLATFRDPDYVPPVTPAVALELLVLARRTDTRFTEVADVCAKDPLVAAHVLRVAQSAFYSRGARILTLEDAIARIGLEALARLFLEVTVTRHVFRVPGYDAAMGALRRHSTLTAYVARALCGDTRKLGDQAFLCGILHDVGAAAAAYVVGTRAPFALAWPVILDAHAEAGRVVCRAWRLPAEIEIVVGYHHAGRVGAHLHPTLCAVAVAEWIADTLGYAVQGVEASPRPETELRALGIDEGALTRVMQDAKKLAARM